MTEKLCLKWNDFQENTNAAFGSLRNNKDFSDITLACEDGEQVEAHKVILAASSPFFQNLLRRNKHPHPLIYMRGVKSEDLVAIVDFLYYGEANVYQERLDSFLEVANELELKGLMKGQNESENTEIPSSKNKEQQDQIQDIQKSPDSFLSVANELDLKGKKSTNKAKNAKIPLADKIIPKLEDVSQILNTSNGSFDTSFNSTEDKTVALFDDSLNDSLNDYHELDQQIKSMMKFSDSDSIFNKNHGRNRICTVCGKEGPNTTIKQHIESHHITGVSHTCQICGKMSKSRSALRTHKATYHKQV